MTLCSYEDCKFPRSQEMVANLQVSFNTKHKSQYLARLLIMYCIFKCGWEFNCAEYDKISNAISVTYTDICLQTNIIEKKLKEGILVVPIEAEYFT